METTFINKGIATVTQATIADKQREYPEAVRLYLLAIEQFRLSLKYTKHAASIKMVQDKIIQYLQRAEEIKKYLDKKRPPVSLRSEPLKEGAPRNEEKDADTADKSSTSMNEAIVRTKPNVRWDDVAGLDAAKASLKEAVILPIRFPHLFTGKRQPWKGILLYGPPGTGKSYLAKAVATEADSTFFSISSSDIMSKWVGESERLVKELFQAARDQQPSIIFIDEIDSLCGTRNEQGGESERRVKTEFLVQMQGVGKDNDGVLVLAATNLPWQLDPAVRRRFEKRIYIPLPEMSARMHMFPIHLADIPHKLTQQDFKRLAEMTDGCSGSDLSILVRDAMMQPIRAIQNATHFKKVTGPDHVDPTIMRDGQFTPCSPGDADAIEMSWETISKERLCDAPVEMMHFMKSALTLKPSVAPADLKKYVEWTNTFGQDG